MANTMSESMAALRLDSERLCCQCMASASQWPPACFWGHLYIDTVACCLSLVQCTVSGQQCVCQESCTGQLHNVSCLWTPDSPPLGQLNA